MYCYLNYDLLPFFVNYEIILVQYLFGVCLSYIKDNKMIVNMCFIHNKPRHSFVII